MYFRTSTWIGDTRSEFFTVPETGQKAQALSCIRSRDERPQPRAHPTPEPLRGRSGRAPQVLKVEVILKPEKLKTNLLALCRLHRIGQQE